MEMKKQSQAEKEIQNSKTNLGQILLFQGVMLGEPTTPC